MNKAKILAEACEFFLDYNSVFIGFSKEVAKEQGKNKLIFINRVKIEEMNLGGFIFRWVEIRKPFTIKWPGLTYDLGDQLLSML